jgi:membrane protease subunit (stomatin/prohibitin family)
MGLFGRSSEGGFVDAIRCDEPEYLVWKWRPAGATGPTHKENALRLGSSLRVKEGEVAVLVYPQADGAPYDFVVGPQDRLLRTLNLPVLTELLGLAYGGDSPFQAEVYFFNLAANNQVRFGLPEFDVFDARFPDLGLPCVVRGSLTFNLSDYRQFIKLNRLLDFDLEDLRQQIRSAFTRQAKVVVTNAAVAAGWPVLQLERRLDELSELLQARLAPVLAEDFGINLKRVDIAAVELDKAHPHYQQLKLSTADQQTKLLVAQTDLGILNLAENVRIQRKETEMQAEARNFPVHQLDLQARVLQAAAENPGGAGGPGPAGLMTGLVMGQQLGGMLGNLAQTPPMPPPPPAAPLYHLALHGQRLGTYTLAQLGQLAAAGQLSPTHHVWREGFSAWELAGQNAEVAAVFAAGPPPPPAPQP